MSSRLAALIVCPMAVERSGLQLGLRLRDPLPSHRVDVSGPGATAIERWQATIVDAPPLIVLVGVAGALASQLAPGDASLVTEVVLASGARLRSPVGGEGWSVAAADRIVATIDAKRALATTSGAEIVDMESGAFATVAERRGWRWAIIRGISDSASDELPSEINRLVDRNGNTRPLAAAALLLRKPHLLPRLRLLGQQTTRAMASVSRLLDELLRKESA